MRNKVLIIGCGRLGANIAALASEKAKMSSLSTAIIIRSIAFLNLLAAIESQVMRPIYRCLKKLI